MRIQPTYCCCCILVAVSYQLEVIGVECHLEGGFISFVDYCFVLPLPWHSRCNLFVILCCKCGRPWYHSNEWNVEVVIDDGRIFDDTLIVL